MSKLLLFLFLTVPAWSAYDGWYKGSVEEAFITAKEQNKPLFLYWGAVWCPPCNQMKKTVFSRPEFAKAMKKYIPVYLDGDSQRAQIWGEKLGSKGYPTMLVMNSAGKELMRMPTGLSTNKYIELLEQVTKNGKDILELVELAKGKQASQEQWEILAGYSWSQFPSEQGSEKLGSLWQLAPNEKIKSQMLMQLLSITPDIKLSQAMMETLSKTVLSKDFVLASLEYISWSVSKLIAEKLPKPQAQQLEKDLFKTLDSIAKKDLNLSQHLQLLYPYVVFNRPNINATVLNKVKEVDQSATDAYARQSAMSDAVYLLIQTNQLKEARTYATKELTISKSPFYFMSYLGMIDEKEGKKKNALSWYKKAWQEAKGDAAIFQWGTSYLIKAMELDPSNKKQITTDLKSILGKVLKQEDAFKGRNLRRMEKLSKSLKAWDQKMVKSGSLCEGALDMKECRRWF